MITRADSRFPNAGHTLVELMVSIVIGLLIILAVSELYLTNKQTFRMTDDASRLEESGKAALDILGYHIRQAGFVDVSDDPNRARLLLNPNNYDWLRKRDATNTNDMISTFFSAAPYAGVRGIMGCDHKFDSMTSVAPPWSCDLSATVGANVLIIAYQARPTVVGGTAVRTATQSYLDTLGAYSTTTGIGGDCGAQDTAGATANPQGALAINLFYIDTSDASHPRLMCLGSGNPADPRTIADDVEDLRLLYGITPAVISGSAPGDAYAGRYVAASQVSDWSTVLSVRVCLQVAAPSSHVTPSQQKFTDCYGATQESTDGKIRQVRWASFALKNNILTSPDVLP